MEGSIPNGYTIIGYPNSTAEEYANKFDSPFQDINKEEQLELNSEVGIGNRNIAPMSIEIEFGYYTLDVATGTITRYSNKGPKIVDIPNNISGHSVTAIGQQAFLNNKITSITIPNSVKTIGSHAFQNNSLTSLTIPNSVTSIGDQAFSQNNLTSVTIPNSVKTIGRHAFSMNSITSVTIPNSVTTIGESAFNTNRLTSVTIPNSVTTIGPYLFAYNELTSVTIPNSVTTIGARAFAYNELTSVIILNKETVLDTSLTGDSKPTIIGYRNSTAQEFANVNNLPFQALDDTISVTITNPSTNQIVNSKGGNIIIKGTANSIDSNVTITAEVGGKKKSITIEGGQDKSWTLTWTAEELTTNGEFSNIDVTATDEIGNSNSIYTGKITIDKVKPDLNIGLTKQ